MSQLQDFPPCNPEKAQLDWVCGPVGQTRDSGSLERANFDTAVLALFEVDQKCEDHDVVRFEHWACGWVEEIFTRPGSAAQLEAHEMSKRLASYPCLDDDLWLEYEMQAEEGKCGT